MGENTKIPFVSNKLREKLYTLNKLLIRSLLIKCVLGCEFGSHSQWEKTK